MTDTPPPPRIVVIGAGFGGMAAALRMKAKGYAVTLIERNDQLGGRARSFEKNGFRHDAGPTVITAPFLFDELFTLFAKKREDYVEFVELDPWYRFYFQDGTIFDYGGSEEKIRSEIARLSPDDLDNYERLVAHSKEIFEVGFNQLADKPFHNVTDMFRQVPALVRLKSYQTVWQFICSYIKNPKLRQALSISPLLVGGNPFETTSIYSLIHYLERRWGIHFAMGGTGAIVKAMRKLMEEEGIEIITSTTVDGFKTHRKTITHVVTDKTDPIQCDKVIFNGDPGYLFKHLMPRANQRLSARLKNKSARLSMGLFVMYFGTTKTYPEIPHHTIWMGDRYKELLDDIFNRKILAEDFSLYIHRPTATDKSFAPDGCESFYILAPVPNLQGRIDWDIEAPRLQERIIHALDQSIMPGLEDHITADFYMTPEDFEQDYLSLDGAGFSVAPFFSQSAWFRYHNKGEGPANLYLVGAGTHRGAGLPGVLSSAKVVDRLIPPRNGQADQSVA